jgi:hypothetical protein
MSDLYEKRGQNPDESGWGFEFTLRAIRRPDALRPPAWAVLLIQQLSAYVAGTGRWFEPGHTIKPGGLTLGDAPTALQALAFMVDPELGTIGTPFGKVTFLQIVALTGEEYAAAHGGNAGSIIEVLGEKIPLHVIDPARGSLL